MNKDKLKTLKDLREKARANIWDWAIEEGGDKLHFNEIIDDYELSIRAIAIEWIKMLEDGEHEWKDKAPYASEQTISWIKHFFNLTEEDLNDD